MPKRKKFRRGQKTARKTPLTPKTVDFQKRLRHSGNQKEDPKVNTLSERDETWDPQKVGTSGEKEKDSALGGGLVFGADLHVREVLTSEGGKVYRDKRRISVPSVGDQRSIGSLKHPLTENFCEKKGTKPRGPTHDSENNRKNHKGTGKKTKKIVLSDKRFTLNAF